MWGKHEAELRVRRVRAPLRKSDEEDVQRPGEVRRHLDAGRAQAGRPGRKWSSRKAVVPEAGVTLLGHPGGRSTWTVLCQGRWTLEPASQQDQVQGRHSPNAVTRGPS